MLSSSTHLVLEGSVDAVMAKRLLEKQKAIDRALNNKDENEALDRAEASDIELDEVNAPEVQTMGSAAEILAASGPPSTAQIRRAELKTIAEKLKKKQVSAIHDDCAQWLTSATARPLTMQAYSTPLIRKWAMCWPKSPRSVALKLRWATRCS